MPQLLCRNRVTDFENWKTVLNSRAGAEAGVENGEFHFVTECDS